MTSRLRVPFSVPDDRDEWEYTTAGRIACAHCGEWIYTRRPLGTDEPHAFPPTCQVCGAAVEAAHG